jgi:hypothetical protein
MFGVLVVGLVLCASIRSSSVTLAYIPTLGKKHSYDSMAEITDSGAKPSKRTYHAKIDLLPTSRTKGLRPFALR